MNHEELEELLEDIEEARSLYEDVCKLLSSHGFDVDFSYIRDLTDFDYEEALKKAIKAEQAEEAYLNSEYERMKL